MKKIKQLLKKWIYSIFKKEIDDMYRYYNFNQEQIKLVDLHAKCQIKIEYFRDPEIMYKEHVIHSLQNEILNELRKYIKIEEILNDDINNNTIHTSVTIAIKPNTI